MRTQISQILGYLAVVVSLGLALYGLPRQIYKNWNAPASCDGLDWALVLTTFIAYLVWSVLGWVRPDGYLAYSQTPGAVFSLILIFQKFLHERKKKKK